MRATRPTQHGLRGGAVHVQHRQVRRDQCAVLRVPQRQGGQQRSLRPVEQLHGQRRRRRHHPFGQRTLHVHRQAGQGNQPVVDVTWYRRALRFANWLNNGQGNGDTETGSYTLLGGTPTPSNASTISRNAGQPNGFCPARTNGTRRRITSRRSIAVPAATGSIRRRATRPRPGNSVLPRPNAATTRPTSTTPLRLRVTGSTSYDPSQDYLTDVGHIPESLSAYGTFDQGGDVCQWNEADISETVRRVVCVAALGRLLRQLGLLLPRPATTRRTRTTTSGSAWQVFLSPVALSCWLGIALTALLYYWRKHA